MPMTSPIKHVFVLMMENHSFDNMLALSGIPGIIAAKTSNSNSWNGNTYSVQGNAPADMPTDPGHEFTDVVEQLAGQGVSYPPHGQYPPITNSGFAANYATTTSEGPAPPPAEIGDIMMCFDTQSQLPVLHQLASQFVVCDQWFSSLPGPTWPNRYFLHGASSSGLDHSPSSEEMAEWEVDGFTYPNGSIFDAMNKKGIKWRLYHDNNGPIEGTVSQVSSLHNIELLDVYDLSTFESDLQSGSYPYQYTFIEPNYGDVINGSYEGGSSQHPMDGVTNGEALIAKVYESIRNSPLWMSSMLIVIYDEHGGFYDHFAPGAAPPPSAASLRNGLTMARGSAMRRRRNLRQLGLWNLKVEHAGSVLAEDVLARLVAQERQIVDRARQVEVPVRVVRGIQELRIRVDHAERVLERLEVVADFHRLRRVEEVTHVIAGLLREQRALVAAHQVLVVEPLHHERNPRQPRLHPNRLELGEALGDAVDHPVGAVDLLIEIDTVCGAGADNVQPPTAHFGETAVHAKQITGENGGFITPRARPDFQETAAFIIRIFG